MNEKHLNPAEALATEHARTIWWARHLTVHTRDPRLRGKKAPALHCGACQEVTLLREALNAPNRRIFQLSGLIVALAIFIFLII